MEALHRAATALAEALDHPLPPLPESSLTHTAAGDVSVIVPKVATAAPFASTAAVLVEIAGCNPASCNNVGRSPHLRCEAGSTEWMCEAVSLVCNGTRKVSGALSVTDQLIVCQNPGIPVRN